MNIGEFVHEGLDRLARIKRHVRTRINVIPSMPSAAVVYHEGYGGIDEYISDKGRARKIFHYLQYEGCIEESQAVSPKTATITQLAMVHDFAYLSQLSEPEVGERIFGQGLTEDMQRVGIEQQRLMTGGTLRAARMAVSSLYPRRIINLGGGFHHAYPEGGYAFCVFNDVAVAIAHLRKHGFHAPILIIDLDLHQGDGSRKIFAHDPTVATYSVHAENWNREPAEMNFDVALGPGYGDAGYLEAIRATLPNVVHQVQPELVFYLAGVDVAEDDELGDWRISHDAIFERDRFVDDVVGKRRMVIVTAGGYGHNAWRHSARFFAYLLSGLEKPVESHNERLIRALKALARSMPVHTLTTTEFDDELFFDFGQSIRRTRLFDFYSKYGVECALEKIGIFAHLKKIGFPLPCLEFDLDHPNGQCVRLYGEEEKRNLLIECILDEKRTYYPSKNPNTAPVEIKTLWIEWLLSQNPTILATRPLLPGQTHPGLGCLPKIIGLLFMVCDRLKFDAIGFNPAHYHVCFLAKGQGFFVQAADEAHFRVAQNLTAGLNLQAASQCLDDGLFCEGHVFKWTPARMLIPISPNAFAHFHDRAWQLEVEKISASEMRKYRKNGIPQGYRIHPTSPALPAMPPASSPNADSGGGTPP